MGNDEQGVKEMRMKCKDCSYWWKDEDDMFAICHFVDKAPGDTAPCEEEERDNFDEEKEI